MFFILRVMPPMKWGHDLVKHLLLPPTTKLWKGNVFKPVCQSFCSQGGYVCVFQHVLGQTPPLADTSLADTPWQTNPGQTSPRGRHLPGKHPSLGRHPPGQTPPLGRPPTTPPKPDGHCSRRYASCWNAFLLCLNVCHFLSFLPIL